MLKAYFRFLIGEPEEFSLRNRMYHAVGLIAIITIFAESIFYQFTSLVEASIICAIVGTIFLGLFYLSRFKKQHAIAINLTILAISVTHLFGYMYNAGIAGNAMLLSVETLFLILLVVPLKQRLFWSIVTVMVLLVMMYLEYKNPGIVKKGYRSREEQYLDLTFAYLLAIVVMYIGMVTLINNYERQKDLAESKAAKLTQSNKEKDKLFSIISHDLNAPIASVKRYLELMQIVDMGSEERAQIEKDLGRSLSQAKILLSNMLHWAKSQMQLQYVNLEVVNIKNLIKDTAAIFQARMEIKGIHLNLKGVQDINIIADPSMLKVVLRNLFNNAIKFSHLEGDIEINTRIAEGQCILSLRDYGIGITTAQQPKIFTLDVSTNYGTANEKGTGLGLILCKDFITQQGGKIWFESTPWEGATFYVSLPVAIG